jgi:hypothetical protein
MFFQKHVNMAPQRKRCVKISSMFLLKFAQTNLQKCTTWPKKSRKGKQEWNKACVEIGICPKKLNTPMKTK